MSDGGDGEKAELKGESEIEVVVVVVVEERSGW